MTSYSGHTAYQEVEVHSSNGLQLVVMLYDGAIRFLGQAKTCIQNRDLHGKTVAVDRSLAILGELRSTLKVEEGGEIAQSLDRMYTYLTGRILEASQKLNVSPLDESMKLLRILNSAWTEIADRAQNPGNSGPAAKLPAAGVPANPASRTPLEIFG